MFKIGDFSKFTFVTVKTLRYYDEIGLLKPVRVDKFTGYRYYSAAQLPRLNYIIALKELGLTLEEIGSLLNDDLTTAQMRDVFLIKQAELRHRVASETRRLERVEGLLLQLEREGKMPEYQIVIKQLPPMKVASVRETIPAYTDIPILWEKICPLFAMNASAVAGPPVAIYHDMEYMEKDVDIELAIPVNAELSLPEPITVRDLPAVETAATMVYRGPYEKIGEAYRVLMTWCETNGYELDGPDREVYLTSPDSTTNPEDYITELQQPVKKIS